jgi:hypothetical protein
MIITVGIKESIFATVRIIVPTSLNQMLAMSTEDTLSECSVWADLNPTQN